MRLASRLIAAAAAVLLGAGAASADRTYTVTITNVTKGQTFTPILVVTHAPRVRLFEPGEPASPELEILAEAGDTGPQSAALEGLGRHAVGDVRTIGGLLGPGETTSVEVTAGRGHRHLSLAAMLIPTNDNFVALDGVRLPPWGDSTFLVPAYDAGTEENDQSCAHIPGPRCGGEGHSPGPNPGDEGFVFVGSGFHELGDTDDEGAEVLGPFLYDWRNPVARVVVARSH